MNYKIRFAVEKDFIDFYGEPLKRSTKAYAIEYNGVVNCICGRTLQDKCSYVFCDVKTTAPKITIWKAARDAIKMIAQTDVPLFALRDGSLCGSKHFLEKLGFSKIGKTEVYKYVGAQ